MNTLDNAIQMSFFDDMERSLASMNEDNYFLEDKLTGEHIKYGQSFILFRGRIFASPANFKDWLFTHSYKKSSVFFEEDAQYNDIWQKYKKSFSRKRKEKQE